MTYSSKQKIPTVKVIRVFEKSRKAWGYAILTRYAHRQVKPSKVFFMGSWK